jgi:hypothetical protein
MKIAQYDLVNRASPEKTYQKKKKQINPNQPVKLAISVLN